MMTGCPVCIAAFSFALFAQWRIAALLLETNLRPSPCLTVTTRSPRNGSRDRLVQTNVRPPPWPSQRVPLTP